MDFFIALRKESEYVSLVYGGRSKGLHAKQTCSMPRKRAESLRGVEFEKRVANLLREARIGFVTLPSMSGIRPDFLVRTPDGRTIVIEAKSWDPTPENLQRASVQAQLYERTTGANSAIVVIPRIGNSRSPEGVVAVSELVETLRLEFRRTKRMRDLRMMNPVYNPPVDTKTKSTVFCAMPFAQEYDDVYFIAMAYAADKNNVVARRVDKVEIEDDINKEIERLIRSSIVVIADLSESRPDVLYEVGFASALGRPTVRICSTPLKELPVSVRNLYTIKYEKGRTINLKDELAKKLQTVLNRR